ncbi:ATP-grasp domain-containing protein [Spongiactinospora sp. TRM90649]|uniref:ATP-grasp domain-containing protein n=1 Tax=Spongiactinospora sp. TRM90649 TaxID=3031114 RepID=UPI0023F7ABF6|nr:ATP-grasp domain-containing protein [Spongiactinospora sp. TRM90649]MDF5755522.1 ATP-grasp domain-containing protein [Spongiactinospora sp. TRM90649]
MRLYITALKPTDSVTDGFLPAARALGCDVTILTDRPEDHGRADAQEVVRCDVRDARAVIDTIAHHHRPDAVFSNSDHIQPETALAAAYFGLPGKDWRACLAAKNKALTRRTLAEAGVERVRSLRLAPGDDCETVRGADGGPYAAAASARVPFPVVVKPREGVASEDVLLVDDPQALASAIEGIRARRPGKAVVVEEYLDGPVRTLETLGDATGVRVLGGFATTLGPPPHFVEERLDWAPARPSDETGHVLAALAALGAGFGACHTEYAITPAGPRVIEVNYRVIGDHCDFLLADLLGVPLFEWILRVHLGEPLPRQERPPRRAGAALSLLADRTGVISAAPPPITPRDADGVRLWHRPLRTMGERVERTGTNRDYLGIVRAVGDDQAGVDAALDAFRAAHPWTVTA